MRRAARRMTERIERTGAWSDDPALIESLAEALRLAILRKTDPILMRCSSSPMGMRMDAQRPGRADRGRCRARRGYGSMESGVPPDFGMAPDLLGTAIDDLPESGGALIVQHLGATSEHQDTLIALDRSRPLRAQGLPVAPRGGSGTRPTFIHAVAAAATRRARGRLDGSGGPFARTSLRRAARDAKEPEE